MHKSYPHPSNWQDFERLCRDLYAAEWGDAGAQLNGRNGDDQGGVDVFGICEGRSIGVQCKLKEQWTAARLTAGQVRSEAEKAKKARVGEKVPRTIDELVIATTAVRLEAAQEEAARLTKHAETPFKVSIDSWDELNDLLNKHTEVRDRFMGWAVPDTNFARERDAYLQSLRERLRPLPMAAIHKHQDRAPTLDEVYTAMDVKTSLASGREISTTRVVGESGFRFERNRYVLSLREHLQRLRRKDDAQQLFRRLRAVEFLAASQHAVLLGPPGSGKSAFLRYVALCLTNAHREDGAGLRKLADPSADEQLEVADIWPYGALIPLLVELRAFTKDQKSFPLEDQPIHAGHILDHLQSENANYAVPSSFVAHLRGALDADPEDKGRGVLLLLDGLDETAGVESVRTRLKGAIEAFVREYPNARVLVTSRPYAYRNEAAWRLPGFEDETLAPLSESAIEYFVRAWYASVAASGTMGTGDVGDRPDALIGRLREPALAPLKARPLTLTLVTSLHAGGEMGHGGRAEVYRRNVELFFNKWNDVRLGEDKQTFEERFGLSRDGILGVLQRVAFRVHGDETTGTDQESEAGQIPLETIWEELQAARGGVGGLKEGDLLEHLDARSGILLAEGDNTFRFPHRSFQEYLAAELWNADDEFPELLVATVGGAPTLWREVLAFNVLGHALPGRTIRNAWDVVDELLPGAPDEEAASHKIAIALAAAFVESEKLAVASPTSRRHARTLETLRNWLVHCLETGLLTAKDRIEAGAALGALGDPRLEHWRANLGVVEGMDVALGRFLVTVQEFDAFVQAGGYDCDAWWEPDGGVDFKRRRGWHKPGGWAGQRRHRNRPIVSVSWYEAAAYCRWLAESSGVAVGLPAIGVRVAAACPDGRYWPWGTEPWPSDQLANYEQNVGHATPVGCYAGGAGAFGHDDLAGNVDEWRGVDSISSGVTGGSWRLAADRLRTRFSYHIPADTRYDDVGFRVCAPASTVLAP